MLSGARIYLENCNGCEIESRFCNDGCHILIMTDKGWVGAVVESGCKGIHTDPNQYFLDLKPVNYDICSFVRVGVPSTYMYFGVICDIF